MKRKGLILWLFVFAVLLVLSFSGASFADTESGGFTYTLLEDGTASITGCSLTGDVVIPSKIDGHKVTNLISQLFMGNSAVTSVSIPATVTYFGTSSGDNMWDYVFSYCYSLQSITVDSGNPSFCSVNGVLFNKQKTILINYPCNKAGTTYHVPGSVTDLCCTSFASCSNLKELYLDGINTWWYTYTFYNDGGLTVYYTPGGSAETKARSEINGGRSYETDSSRPTFKDSKPVITSQPTSVSVAEGAAAIFKVTASNANSYQWYYRTSSDSSWTAVKNNGKSATYSLTTEARHNGYQYRCRVKNSAGSVYSKTVTLTVQTKPAITSQPSSATVNEGKTATFKVTATGGGLSYQWQYRKSSAGSWTTVKNNGTSATYSLTTEARHNGYQYRCKVTNKAGSATSKTVTLTVVAKPVITGQPSSVTVTKGKTATFKVTATGATSYQWQYRTSSSGSWTDVKNNGTSATYLLKTEARHNGYQYRCKVTNSAGSVYTSIVKLTVK